MTKDKKKSKYDNELRNKRREVTLRRYQNGEKFGFQKGNKLASVNKGRKIELFGNYWHSKIVTGKSRNKEERDRINHFKKYGFDCLIIWEEELDNLSLLKEKIINYNKI